MSSCDFCEVILTMIMVDTNIVIDVSSNDQVWADWSQQQLDFVAAQGFGLSINDAVYAELAVGYRHSREVDALLAKIGVVLTPIPRRALFLAGKAFQLYRRAGGVRTGVLSDFFIGAHAVIANSALITRDPRRYRTYFPGIELITPSVN
jgi:predicted nucleic acid-binding protein